LDAFDIANVINFLQKQATLMMRSIKRSLPLQFVFLEKGHEGRQSTDLAMSSLACRISPMPSSCSSHSAANLVEMLSN